MNLGEPLAVGFLPKGAAARPRDWKGPPVVVEICSVSECIVPGPDDRILKWLHNDLGFYPSEATARKVVEASGRYEMYGYRVYPWRFDEGNVRPWSPPVDLELDFTSFDSLGYDVVAASSGLQPDCSPLSCNSAAKEFPVNKHCLIEAPSKAYDVCIAISQGDYEPGPYYLYEVHRRREGG